MGTRPNPTKREQRGASDTDAVERVQRLEWRIAEQQRAVAELTEVTEGLQAGLAAAIGEIGRLHDVLRGIGGALAALCPSDEVSGAEVPQHPARADAQAERRLADVLPLRGDGADNAR